MLGSQLIAIRGRSGSMRIAALRRARLDVANVIDVDRASRLLLECVAERGHDYVYQPRFIPSCHYTTCVYVYDGRPDCLIGHFLARCGVGVSALAALGDDDVESLHSGARLPVRLSPAAVALLQRIQESQDLGRTWGQALRDAGAISESLDERPERGAPWQANPQAPLVPAMADHG